MFICFLWLGRISVCADNRNYNVACGIEKQSYKLNGKVAQRGELTKSDGVSEV